METGVHNSWRLSPWSKKLHGAGLFIADEEEGQIEIPEAGLYLVYAQVCTKIQQIKILVTCQRFGDWFLFGLVWPYSSNQKNIIKVGSKSLLLTCSSNKL